MYASGLNLMSSAAQASYLCTRALGLVAGMPMLKEQVGSAAALCGPRVPLVRLNNIRLAAIDPLITSPGLPVLQDEVVILPLPGHCPGRAPIEVVSFDIHVILLHVSIMPSASGEP